MIGHYQRVVGYHESTEYRMTCVACMGRLARRWSREWDLVLDEFANQRMAALQHLRLTMGAPRSPWRSELSAPRGRNSILQRSHGEFTGRAARHYDLVMDLLLLGQYQAFIEQAIGRMDLRRGETILDLGSGTGRNILVMLEFLGSTGRVLGVDSSQDMIQQARERCRAYPQVTFLRQPIEDPLPLHEEFDKAFVSFTLHSLEDEDKERVLANVRRALKRGGMLWILDFNEFDLDRQWLPFQWAFRRIECELGIEFLSLDLRGMLACHGFGRFVGYPFLLNHVRLLGAEKMDAGGEA